MSNKSVDSKSKSLLHLMRVTAVYLASKYKEHKNLIDDISSNLQISRDKNKDFELNYFNSVKLTNYNKKVSKDLFNFYVRGDLDNQEIKTDLRQSNWKSAVKVWVEFINEIDNDINLSLPFMPSGELSISYEAKQGTFFLNKLNNFIMNILFLFGSYCIFEAKWPSFFLALSPFLINEMLFKKVQKLFIPFLLVNFLIFFLFFDSLKNIYLSNNFWIWYIFSVHLIQTFQVVRSNVINKIKLQTLYSLILFIIFLDVEGQIGGLFAIAIGFQLLFYKISIKKYRYFFYLNFLSALFSFLYITQIDLNFNKYEIFIGLLSVTLFIFNILYTIQFDYIQLIFISLSSLIFCFTNSENNLSINSLIIILILITNIYIILFNFRKSFKLVWTRPFYIRT